MLTSSGLRRGGLVQGGGRKLCLWAAAGAAPWGGGPGSDGIQP